MKNIILLLSIITTIFSFCCSAKVRKAKPEKPDKTEYSAISDNFKVLDSLILKPEDNSINENENSKNNKQEKDKRPNIIIVLADDLDAIYTPQYFPEVLPVIDSLQKLGIDFTNSFTPMSICCPSRSATLTGSYAHTNGVYRNASFNGGWSAFRHNEPYTLPAYLNKTGYRTTMIGKYLNGYGDDKNPQPIFGWTDGMVFTNFFFYKGYGYNILSWDNGKPINDIIWSFRYRRICPALICHLLISWCCL